MLVRSRWSIRWEADEDEKVVVVRNETAISHNISFRVRVISFSSQITLT